MQIEDIYRLIGIEQKEFYLSLNPNTQKDLWIEKIERLIRDEMDSDYIVELNEYKDFVLNFNFHNPVFTNEDLEYFNNFWL